LAPCRPHRQLDDLGVLTTSVCQEASNRGFASPALADLAIGYNKWWQVRKDRQFGDVRSQKHCPLWVVTSIRVQRRLYIPPLTADAISGPSMYAHSGSCQHCCTVVALAPGRQRTRGAPIRKGPHNVGLL